MINKWNFTEKVIVILITILCMYVIAGVSEAQACGWRDLILLGQWNIGSVKDNTIILSKDIRIDIPYVESEGSRRPIILYSGTTITIGD
ncbi:MAG TPA: hypothetical protein ENI23_06395 [bacterium]|nr:hypothetical protein [bacterium]